MDTVLLVAPDEGVLAAARALDPARFAVHSVAEYAPAAVLAAAISATRVVVSTSRHLGRAARLARQLSSGAGERPVVILVGARAEHAALADGPGGPLHAADAFVMVTVGTAALAEVIANAERVDRPRLARLWDHLVAIAAASLVLGFVFEHTAIFGAGVRAAGRWTSTLVALGCLAALLVRRAALGWARRSGGGSAAPDA